MNTYTAALSDTNPEEAYAKVKNEFSSFFDKYGSKASGKLALILYGDISYSAKDADTAIDMYDRALEAFGKTPAMKNIVLSPFEPCLLAKRQKQ
jgi:TolA-binding protein